MFLRTSRDPRELVQEDRGREAAPFANQAGWAAAQKLLPHLSNFATALARAGGVVECGCSNRRWLGPPASEQTAASALRKHCTVPDAAGPRAPASARSSCHRPPLSPSEGLRAEVKPR